MTKTSDPLVWLNGANNTLKTRKSCQLCLHKKMCKFLANAEKSLNDNFMYGMEEYANHHNALKAFEQFSSCQYYETFLLDRDLFLKHHKDYDNQLNEMFKLNKEYIKLAILPKHKEFVNNKISELRTKPTYDSVEDDRISDFTYSSGSKDGVQFVRLDNKEYNYTYYDIFEFFGAFEKK